MHRPSLMADGKEMIKAPHIIPGEHQGLVWKKLQSAKALT